MWGNPLGISTQRTGLRSIPTCVGQPQWRIATKFKAGVYPHVCGATTRLTSVRVMPMGLSPRVWGNPGAGQQRWSYSGSIPTCVGQPPVEALPNLVWQVYPHVCGATFVGACFQSEQGGLSPRVWGNP